MCLYASMSFAYDFKVDGIYYRVISSKDLTVAVTTSGLSEEITDYPVLYTVDGIKLTNYYKWKVYYNYKGSCVIPESVFYNGLTYTVVSIDDYTFTKKVNDNVTKYLPSDVTNIILPKTIKSIGAYAFMGCQFTEIRLPEGITEIPTAAFYGSTLANIEIPKSVEKIENSAFRRCNLHKVIIPSGVEEIGSNAFLDCPNLTMAFLLNNKVEYNKSAFPTNTLCFVPSDSTTIPQTNVINMASFSKNEQNYNGEAIKDVTITNNLKRYDPAMDMTTTMGILEKKAGAWTTMLNAHFSNSDDIDFEVEIPYTYTIKKAPLKIIVNDTKRTYGEENPEFTYRVQGLVNGENESVLGIKLVTDATKTSKEGEYEISATIENENYELTVQKGVLTVTDEDTDLSKYPNVLYIDGDKANVGATRTLSLKMNNEVSVTGFQCDVYIPNGTSIARDEDGFCLMDISTERTTAKKTDYFNTSIMPDGSTRILCSSTKSYPFEGNEGEVATISLSIGSSLKDGSYPLILRNIIITDDLGRTYKVDYVKTSLNVTTYTLGDANGDTEINVGDFTCIANHIMGNTPASFVVKAADVNRDSEINVGDLTCVANLILYGSVTSTTRAKGTLKGVAENEVSITTAEMKSDRTAEVSIAVENGIALTGFQFDLEMPEGISVATDDVFLSTARTTKQLTDFFTTAKMNDGSVRILCNSSKAACFEGNCGEVVKAKVSVSENIPSGDYMVTLRRIVLADIEGNAYNINDAKAVISVGDVTGVKTSKADAMKNIKVFSVDGMQRKSLKNGVNIIRQEDGTVKTIHAK